MSIKVSRYTCICSFFGKTFGSILFFISRLNNGLSLSVILLSTRNTIFVGRCHHILFCMNTWLGEWNEAVWKEVSLSLSQNFPSGGFVWTKNIPEDHRSNIKLQVPKCWQWDIKVRAKLLVCHNALITALKIFKTESPSVLSIKQIFTNSCMFTFFKMI